MPQPLPLLPFLRSLHPCSGSNPYLLGEETRAVVMVVPASIDVPHLIYRNKYFGAPLRNGPDTEWMLERQIDALYRARFEEQRTARTELNQIYAEAAGHMRGSTRAWAVAAARPRLPVVARERLHREEARSIFLGVEDTSGPLVRGGERRWPGPARTWNDSARRPVCGDGSPHQSRRSAAGGPRPGPPFTTTAP